LRKFNAPLHAATPLGAGASPAPGILCQIGAEWSRRAVLGGALALWASFARAGGTRLDAAPLAGRSGAFGYNGASPGPLLRGRVGEPMTVSLVNGLAAPTTLRLPGGPGGLGDSPVAPGAARDFSFTPTEPGFDLYGPFAPGTAAGAWDAGLFGAIVIDEPAPPPVDLDAVVVFSGADASALRANADPAPLTLTAPPGARVRLRLANATPDLLLNLRASDAAAAIVAIDGQPCPPFAPRGGEFPICPGGRFELMFDLVAAFELVWPERPALRIAPRAAPAAKRPPMAPLPANPRLPDEIALERARQVRIVIGGSGDAGFTLNGSAAWPGKPLFNVARGTPVALTLVNETSTPQTLRLEGHVARILHALDDGWDPYWRDALFIAPGRTLHAAFVADAPGRWPLASASEAQRAKGMAGWYAVA